MLAATAYFFYTYKGSTLNEELSDFAVADTASITKLFLADKSGNAITLTKQAPGQWLINGTTPARTEAVKLLLTTIKSVEVRSPVGRFAYNNIIKQLASYGIKIEIYQHDELTKTYYVGGATQDNLGTFMYLENSSVPFVTHIPGFNGFLTPRYFTSINAWKERSVFKYPAGSIAQLSITDKENASGTFTIKYNDAVKKYELYDSSNQLVADALSDKLAAYLDFYANISYEGVAEKVNRLRADSLATAGSFLLIDIKDKSGKTQHVEFIRKPIDRRTLSEFDAQGNKPKYDLDRMLTRIDNDTALVLTQYLLFDKLFQKADEFRKSNSIVVKK